jgi:maltooligosyltrehalose trehalohydrolase
MNEQVPSNPPCGAVLDEGGNCTWRVWAPLTSTMQLVLLDSNGEQRSRAMRAESNGCFVAFESGIREGQRYAFQRNGGPLRPDPASRWQPDGVHAPSAVIRLEAFDWSDVAWLGIARRDLVIYELHTGTFTPDGTFDAVIPRLIALRELGVTAVELMPVGQFPGTRDWGYDGVGWFAVQNSYGGPRGLQRLVNAAHAAGLAVILDVVYNHLGPEGSYLAEFGPYFSPRHHTPWGDAVNFDDHDCEMVRAHVLHNVQMWVRDFHLDGLRLDATHAIIDDGPQHILREIADVAHEAGRTARRRVHVIAESETVDPLLLTHSDCKGYGLDAAWSDGFHHAVHALLTGERNGYYRHYDRPEEQLAAALADPFLEEGRVDAAVDAGTFSADRFVICIQNHDQIGNRAAGDRLTTLLQPAQLRLAAGLMLLSPRIPLLFMGEEYGETRPFPFFCDFGDPELQAAVSRGRSAEFAAFGWADRVPDPQAAQTWASAKLAWTWPEGTWNAGLRRLYVRLLAARREWPELQSTDLCDVQVLAPACSRPWLTLIRRAGQTPAIDAAGSTLEIHFNLTDSAITLPISAATALLRSESPDFGGSAAKHESHLLPFEFVAIRI